MHRLIYVNELFILPAEEYNEFMQSIPTKLQSLTQNLRLKSVPIDQILIYADDPVDDAYILKKGYVKIYDIDDNGNEKILHIVSPPAVIPFAFFSGADVHTRWFYATLTDAEVYVVSQKELKHALFGENDTTTYMVNSFSQDVHELLARLSSLGKTNVADKLIATFNFFVVCHAQRLNANWWRVPYIVNHQLLADIVGTTRESVTTALKALQNDGLVRFPKVGVLEINRTKLQKLT